MSSDRWYQKLWKSFTRMFRVGEQKPSPHVDMSDCMEGKPLSDTTLQDCLFNSPPSINTLQKPLPVYPMTWPLERLKGKPIFLQLPCENKIIYERYWNRMSLNCIPEEEEEEESTRSTNVELKDARVCAAREELMKDFRDNLNLKDSRDHFATVKDCMGSSKEEPESTLEAYIRKLNERLECKTKNPESEGCTTVWIS
ncbi:hypothetical protein TNCT_52851 [Trichonephila clavata]|uniref:Uncharacterized protein n=3 Tax=Trichonephila clavata TaxID=2740835 RepID=A0A8X6KZB0_TRICU|nr:hypothetical protein TNCT_199261 [Trichonephila clavata]GFQ87828.1 hypothetical protein TNCT_52851 [Trichonephila clavata]